MAQFLRPASDISLGTWEGSAGSPTELWPMLDETSPADADYIYTETADDVCEVMLSSGTDPGVDTGHIVRYRIQGDGATPITVQLFDNSVSPQIEVASWVEQSPVVGTTPQTYEYELSESQASGILDYTALSLRFTAGIVAQAGEGAWYRSQLYHR